MNHGKTIELFFVNGTADDVVTAELSNWNAQAIRIPRAECRNPKQEHVTNVLQGVGVYFRGFRHKCGSLCGVTMAL